ncbi:hypothetical protein [Aestuariimicrobium ganziense]|uniref:hypothetical protein n=1 Tax=Aestuariimicrobium ganziense TaxID=2773677 RepID=UPI0019451914|nr:hypothetical protein [Aestuariimicrobium ganziense]
MSGKVIPWPATGETVMFIGAPGLLSSAIAATFFDLKVGPLARSCATTAGVAEGADLPAPSAGERAVMAELGMDLGRCDLVRLTDDVVRTSSHIVVLGSSTCFDAPPGRRCDVERWPLDEPSHRGIEGLNRLRLIRDGIESNVNTLVSTLGLDASSR